MEAAMTPDEILSLPSMPPGNPSYPTGPYRFLDREYFIVVYESDPDAIRRMVPEPRRKANGLALPERPISLPSRCPRGRQDR